MLALLLNCPFPSAPSADIEKDYGVTLEQMATRFEQQIAFVLEVDKLKNILRQTLITDASRRENSAEHSWHLAIMAPLLAEYASSDLDTGRVVRMLLIHDIVEIDAGDTFAYDVAGNLDKSERETRAANRIFGLLPEDQRDACLELWREFEDMQTPEAKFANALDSLQPLLHNWKTQGASWKKNQVHRSQVYKRLDRVRLYIPEAWPLVSSIIENATSEGWLQGD